MVGREALAVTVPGADHAYSTFERARAGFDYARALAGTRPDVVKAFAYVEAALRLGEDMALEQALAAGADEEAAAAQFGYEEVTEAELEKLLAEDRRRRTDAREMAPRQLMTGPRGGVYYVAASGRKVYVKRMSSVTDRPKKKTPPEEKTKSAQQAAPPAHHAPAARKQLGDLSDRARAKLVHVGTTKESVSEAMSAGLERAGFERFYGAERALNEVRIVGQGAPKGAPGEALSKNTLGKYQSQANRLLLNGDPDVLQHSAQSYELKDKINPGKVIPGRGGIRKDVPDNVHHIASTPEKVAEITATHEFGHALHMHGAPVLKGYGTGDVFSDVDRVIKDAYDDPKREAVSKYADDNRLEYWAESFAAYHHYPRAWMQTNAPKALKMVETVLEMRGMK